ncbi:DUF2004 domain-containing protein [Candidatus Stoquefichus massiliensis]|uniref:DUF2004 domain-containing protein n=1 Tax=Candidatus Stoquefichus massiliensis TaxID=1470350 RepID=UPI00048300D4|nr:DUF2004 domain-containing protein [Candidatus Stoquefichus massiliensis]
MFKIKSQKYSNILYEPTEDIWFDINEVGTPFRFDVTEEITKDEEKMNKVGFVLDNIDNIISKVFDYLHEQLQDTQSQYYSIISYFLEFHYNEFKDGRLGELLGIKDDKDISVNDMLKYLKLNRLGSDFDEKFNDQIYILDFMYNTDMTDEILVVYLNSQSEVIVVTHES